MSPLSKVARAIAEASGASSSGFRFEERREHWESVTRVALEELRNCTSQIVDENLDRIEEGDGGAFDAMLRLVLEGAS